MKKILYFITQAEFGGAQRYVFDLANNLKNDHEVAVALGEQGNNGKLAKILTENNIKYFTISRLKRNLSPVNDAQAFFQIIKLIKNYQPDIIHLNSSKISILGSLAAFLIKLRTSDLPAGRQGYELQVIYTAHGWVFNEPLPFYLKYFYLWAEKFTARFKDKIICVSEYDRQTALQKKIAPANKLVTIHNGIAPINFYPKDEAKTQIARVASYELRDAKLLIGSVGNLYKTKGYEYLIEAASILLANPDLSFPRRRESRFIIIGEGAERKKLESLIKKYNLENNFILVGQIDNAAELLPAFDLYVCASVKEGLPYSILEAMQAGLPIISTDVGGIPEMIAGSSKNSGQATGLLSKPADANDLAEKIKLLINNKTLAEELGLRAKEKAKTEFGLTKMIEATKKVYN